MSFTSWLLEVERLLGFRLYGDAALDAHRHYRDGWSIDEYATEIDWQLTSE